MNFEILTYGDPEAETLLVQMVDDHDMEGMDSEIACLRELTDGQPFCLKAVRVHSWNSDLSPWPAPAVFGTEDFGEGAPGTLQFLLEHVVPERMPGEGQQDLNEGSSQGAGRTGTAGQKGPRILLGGYSLAALFALWAGYQTDRFSGIAAASPSIWFPRFTDYMRQNPLHADAVYLSLGDREERTGNPVMAQVGNRIREAESILRDAGKACTLEWNKGNHFKQPDIRTAKAFAWLMNAV